MKEEIGRRAFATATSSEMMVEDSAMAGSAAGVTIGTEAMASEKDGN
jgi:hypothetical protein